MPGTVCKIIRCGGALAAMADTIASEREDLVTMGLEDDAIAIMERAYAQLLEISLKVEAGRGK